MSDNGSQLTSRKFNEFCKSLVIRQIFTTYNNPKGNANTERYFRTVKEEIPWPRECETFEELKKAIEEFERFYNYKYPHSAIGYISKYVRFYIKFPKILSNFAENVTAFRRRSI